MKQCSNLVFSFRSTLSTVQSLNFKINFCFKYIARLAYQFAEYGFFKKTNEVEMCNIFIVKRNYVHNKQIRIELNKNYTEYHYLTVCKLYISPNFQGIFIYIFQYMQPYPTLCCIAFYKILLFQKRFFEIISFNIFIIRTLVNASNAYT